VIGPGSSRTSSPSNPRGRIDAGAHGRPRDHGALVGCTVGSLHNSDCPIGRMCRESGLTRLAEPLRMSSSQRWDRCRREDRSEIASQPRAQAPKLPRGRVGSRSTRVTRSRSLSTRVDVDASRRRSTQHGMADRIRCHFPSETLAFQAFRRPWDLNDEPNQLVCP
jgi:hypothetical protein